ncbi:MAG: S8/S53 family peptidase [Clostridiaceae bacterium]|nr:S8/S53 family peptidase [Clostridiaceae bacterium]
MRRYLLRLQKLIALLCAAAVLLGLLSGCGPRVKSIEPDSGPSADVPWPTGSDPSAPVADFTGLDFWNQGTPDENGVRDARSSDLTEATLPEDPAELGLITFDSRTKWPKSLPDGFDPSEIMEAEKDPGLGVRALHEKGITGAGVTIAILDSPLLTDHVEYKDQLRYYRDLNDWTLYPEEYMASMHGLAVASIAVGKTTGVAPEADLLFVALDFAKEQNWSLQAFAEGLEHLLDVNETLPQEQKVRVISVSRGMDSSMDGYDDWKKAVLRAKEAGIFVVTVSLDQDYPGMGLNGMSRELYADPNDFDASRPGILYRDNFYYNPRAFYKIMQLYVPMDFRTLASPTGTEDYVRFASGGLSWAVPWFAGVYALACQVKPDITPEEFWEVAYSTGKVVKFEKDRKVYRMDRVMDPAALIAELQQKN